MSRRIVVTGNMGAGKTTLAGTLSSLLDAPRVEMDALRHGANWVETPDDVFRERVSQALAGSSWVVDGDYEVVRDIVWPQADTLVWLDYPSRMSMWRLLWRTFRRCIAREELWNGNRETFYQHLFTRESILLEGFRRRGIARKVYGVLLEKPEYEHLRVVRLQSPRKTREWLSGLPHSGGILR